MSFWVALAIGCTFNIKSPYKVLHCEAGDPVVHLSKWHCMTRKKASQQCIEFKKGDYLVKYEGVSNE